MTTSFWCAATQALADIERAVISELSCCAMPCHVAHACFCQHAY